MSEVSESKMGYTENTNNTTNSYISRRSKMIEQLKNRLSDLITNDILRKIVSKRLCLDNPIITSIKFGKNPKKGDAYLSIVTRFSIEAEQNGQKYLSHYIGKGLPRNLARRTTFRSVDFFRNEIGFYEKVWPVLDTFQNCKKIQNPIMSIPNCLMTHFDTRNDFVVLEDVTYAGYTSLPRNKPLDLETATKIIREFARFHALSLAVRQQHPREFDDFSNHIQETYYVERYRRWYTPMLLKTTIILQDIITDILPCKYLDKLDNLMSRDLFGEVVKVCEEKDECYGVTQGDCWAPNFLVKRSEDKFDMKIIDYQVCRCGSVTMDLPFFLYTCVDQEVLLNHWEELIVEYHCSIACFLKELDSPEDMITIDMIKSSLERTGMYTFVMGLDAVIMSSVDSKDAPDIDALEVETSIDKAYKLQLITDSERKDKIAFFFKHIVDKGLV